MKKFYESKTIWFSTALVIFGAVQQFLPQLEGMISPSFYGYTIFAVGVVSAVLRTLTTTAIK